MFRAYYRSVATFADMTAANNLASDAFRKAGWLKDVMYSLTTENRN